MFSNSNVLPEKYKSNLKLLFVEINYQVSFKTITFDERSQLIIIKTVEWLPCFYKLTFEVVKDNFLLLFKICH
jgi:hypothetical protein